jgi:hypothetical protein
MSPDCDQVCSTYKVLCDLSSNQYTQGLHSLCMLYCKLTCTVFFPLSILILQKSALLIPALYKFDDGVPCVVS